MTTGTRTVHLIVEIPNALESVLPVIYVPDAWANANKDEVYRAVELLFPRGHLIAPTVEADVRVSIPLDVTIKGGGVA